jgi:hypothetical protein
MIVKEKKSEKPDDAHTVSHGFPTDGLISNIFHSKNKTKTKSIIADREERLILRIEFQNYIIITNPTQTSQVLLPTNCIVAFIDTARMNSETDDSPDNENSSFLMDLFSSDNPQSGTLFCTHCRQHLSRNGTKTKDHIADTTPPPALRCSRCQSVHYCSRKCQKANFPLHKSFCKSIHDRRLSSSLPPSALSPSEDDKFRRHELALSLVGLAYMSTDTIDRGRKIYHLALMEYFRLLRIDFHHVGVLESILMLLSILGYDDPLCGLIDFVFYRLEHHPNEKISVYNKNNGTDEDPRLVAWVQGIESPDRKKLMFWLGVRPDKLDLLDLLEGQQWCANNFLVPLLFWNMKQMDAAYQQSRKGGTCVRDMMDIHRIVAANLGYAIEERQVGELPILWAMFPDSNQRWTRDEASELFALPSDYEDDHDEDEYTNHWEGACILFWHIFKDAIAFYPLIDSLEDTIRSMRNIRWTDPITELDPTQLAEVLASEGSL